MLSAPITIHATYETLVTMAAGDYETSTAAARHQMEQVDGGNAWLFHLRQGVKFHSGNPFTAVDVKFTLDRLKALKDNPAELAENIKSVSVVDIHTVKVTMVDKAQPLLNLLRLPDLRHHGFEGRARPWRQQRRRRRHQGQGERVAQPEPAGTGPYILTQWERNAQITLKQNPDYWRKPVAFERVVIKHFPESTSQVLAVKRGDIDAALNLTPPQLDGLKTDKSLKLIEGTSLDFVYMTLTGSADLNKDLAKKEARQAVAYGIDYDGLIKGLMKGYATRPPTFIPGTRRRHAQDHAGNRLSPRSGKGQAAPRQGGLPKGFSFEPPTATPPSPARPTSWWPRRCSRISARSGSRSTSTRSTRPTPGPSI